MEERDGVVNEVRVGCVSEQALDCWTRGEWDGGRRLGKDARDVTGSLGGPGSFLE